MITYSYTKYVDDDRLALEIRNSLITIALASVLITGEETLDVNFKAELNIEEKFTLDDLVNAHINQPITVRDSVELVGIDITDSAEKAIKVAATKLEGSSTQKVSHDFCDATTWYTDSLRIEDKELSTVNDLTFTSDNLNWIDLTHGKVPYEDRLASAYHINVKVNGTLTSDAFSIDYSKGEITFEESKSGARITASYSYEDGSTWKVTPAPNKILKIMGTTIKFTSDVVLGEGQSINFQLYVGGNPYGQPTVYKNVKDIIKCTMLAPSRIPGFGDVSQDVNFLPFDYITSKDVKSSSGMEIRIWLSKHRECLGEFGIVTAHCLSLKE